jgi:methionyl-tRNA formyltransferase
MGVCGVRIVFLTTDDRIYLPAFYERVLAEYGDQTAEVCVVPPLYKNQTTRSAAWRYYRTFGANGVRGLATRLAQAKVHGRSIMAACKSHDVKCAFVADVNAPSFLDHLRELRADLLVSVSCPQIFKRDLIDLPELGCLNIHGAALPLYRGVMPSFWMLANGEQDAGVSIYFVNEKIDAGELCGQRIFAIEPDETLDAFLRRSKAIAADLLIEVLGKLERGELPREALDLSKGSYYSWPDTDAVRRFRAAGRRLW